MHGERPRKSVKGPDLRAAILDALTHAAIRSDHFPQRYAALITFVTGGIDALLGGKPR